MKKIFAAVSVGSTALAMKVAEVSGRGIRTIDEIRYPLSLGAETYTIGKIRYPMVEKICAVMSEFARIMKEYGAESCTAYATSAVREASNSEYIIDRINLRTGIKVSILSNEEEHFLQNKALALYDEHFDEMIEKGAVIIDSSSGNIQVTLYERSQLKLSQNIPLGPMRVAEKTAEYENTGIKYTGVIRDFLEYGIKKYKNSYMERAKTGYFVFTGGLSGYLKRLAGAEDREYISYEDIEKAYNVLEKTPVDEICRRLDITHERAASLLSDVMFYEMFTSFDKSKKIFVSELSLEDGMCVEFAEKEGCTHTRHIFTQDIISSAKFYADKYGCDKAHYEAVTAFADELFRAAGKKFGLSNRDRVLLNVAAIMADTGYFINVNEYSKYSFDIVTANRILGLSDKEVRTIAYTLLFHAPGVKMDTPGYNALTKSHRLLISKLTAILALAKTLDTGRNGKISSIKAGFKKEKLYVRAHASGDLTVETAEFNAAAEFFEEVFGIRPELKAVHNA